MDSVHNPANHIWVQASRIYSFELMYFTYILRKCWGGRPTWTDSWVEMKGFLMYGKTPGKKWSHSSEKWSHSSEKWSHYSTWVRPLKWCVYNITEESHFWFIGRLCNPPRNLNWNSAGIMGTSPQSESVLSLLQHLISLKVDVCPPYVLYVDDFGDAQKSGVWYIWCVLIWYRSVFTVLYILYYHIIILSYYHSTAVRV